MRLSLPVSKSDRLAWLPVLAVGLLLGLGDLHQSDAPVTAGLVFLLACFFATGTRLPWYGIGIAIAAFVPVGHFLAAAFQWPLGIAEHGVVKHAAQTLVEAAGSLSAPVFGVAGALMGLCLRGLFASAPE